MEYAFAAVLLSDTTALTGYIYNHNGMRVSKTVTDAAGTAKTEYVVNATRILHMKKVQANGNEDTLHFYYDGMGRASMVSYNRTKYAYVHNLQGDIVGILDTNGSLIVKYNYDVCDKQTAVA